MQLRAGSIKDEYAVLFVAPGSRNDGICTRNIYAIFVPEVSAAGGGAVQSSQQQETPCTYATSVVKMRRLISREKGALSLYAGAHETPLSGAARFSSERETVPSAHPPASSRFLTAWLPYLKKCEKT